MECKVVDFWIVVLEMVFVSFCSSEFSIFFIITIYYFWNENKQRIVGIRYGIQKKEDRILGEKYCFGYIKFELLVKYLVGSVQ